MKTITIDFSEKSIGFPDGKVIGCEGIHNVIKLTAILPERMICEQINAYTMLFRNGDGELVCSDELLLDGNTVSCVLWEQLFCGKVLSVQVQGIGVEDEKIVAIDKTSVAELEIERSVDGEATQSDFDSHSALAQLAVLREKIALIEILGSVNGVALSKSEINSKGELLLTYSNGKTYNIGSVKGERGADGKDGSNGKDGANGTSATHSWDGTTLTITSASGTSSANLKGEKGDKGEKGEKGANGIDGYTPVKGIDYWSASDRAEMGTDNIAFISTELAKRMQLKPEFANSVEDCTDTAKLYVLPDGYIYAYMRSTVYPEITIEEKTGGFWRLKDGSIQWSEVSGYSSKHTNIIPVSAGDTLEYTGMAMWNAISVTWYDNSGNILSVEQYNENESTHTTVTVTAPEGAVSAQFYSFRASGSVDNVTLSVKWVSCAGATSVKWSNTGLCFVANGQEEASAKSPLEDKKIVYDGDSICAGTYGGGGYAKLIADKTNCNYVNRAVGGGRLITKANSNDNFHSVVDDLTSLPTDADLYCFEGGINDWWSYGVLGSYDTENFTGELDTSTVCGALETVFRYAINNFVGKAICFVITHKIQRTAYVKNENGNTFKDYHDAMVGICNKYSIPYYDAFLESGLNGWNDTQSNAFLTGNANGTADGCHPNEDGYERYYVPQLISLFERIIPRGDA